METEKQKDAVLSELQHPAGVIAYLVLSAKLNWI